MTTTKTQPPFLLYFLGIFKSPGLDLDCPVQSMKSKPMELHPNVQKRN